MRHTVAAAFLGAAFFSTLGSAVFLVVAAAGLASFFASLTGPEVPVERVSNVFYGWGENRASHATRCAAVTYPWDV